MRLGLQWQLPSVLLFREPFAPFLSIYGVQHEPYEHRASICRHLQSSIRLWGRGPNPSGPFFLGRYTSFIPQTGRSALTLKCPIQVNNGLALPWYLHLCFYITQRLRAIVWVQKFQTRFHNNTLESPFLPELNLSTFNMFTQSLVIAASAFALVANSIPTGTSSAGGRDKSQDYYLKAQTVNASSPFNNYYRTSDSAIQCSQRPAGA